MGRKITRDEEVEALTFHIAWDKRGRSCIRKTDHFFQILRDERGRACAAHLYFVSDG